MRFCFGTHSASALLLAALLLAGCASSAPGYSHPDFAQHYQNRYEATGWVALVTDVVLTRDIGGKLDLVDVPRSLTFGEVLADSAAAQLRRKGYAVTSTAPPSVGRVLEFDVSFRTLWTENDRDADPGALPVERAPFVWDGETAAHVDMGALKTARLHRGTMVADFALAPERAEEVTLMIAVMSRRIPLIKQLGQALLTSLVSGGMYYQYEQSYLQVAFFVVDASTGDVLWADTEADVGDLSIDLHDATGRLAVLIDKLPAPRSPRTK
jgi:hypothetical protein